MRYISMASPVFVDFIIYIKHSYLNRVYHILDKCVRKQMNGVFLMVDSIASSSCSVFFLFKCQLANTDEN